MSRDPLVCIVDDDEAIRESLRLLLYASGLGSHGFASADAFLADDGSREFDCMLLDIRMPGTDGLELFRELQRRQVAYPVVFITGCESDLIPLKPKDGQFSDINEERRLFYVAMTRAETKLDIYYSMRDQK